MKRFKAIIEDSYEEYDFDDIIERVKNACNKEDGDFVRSFKSEQEMMEFVDTYEDDFFYAIPIIYDEDDVLFVDGVDVKEFLKEKEEESIEVKNFLNTPAYEETVNALIDDDFCKIINVMR